MPRTGAVYCKVFDSSEGQSMKIGLFVTSASKDGVDRKQSMQSQSRCMACKSRRCPPILPKLWRKTALVSTFREGRRCGRGKLHIKGWHNEEDLKLGSKNWLMAFKRVQRKSYLIVWREKSWSDSEIVSVQRRFYI